MYKVSILVPVYGVQSYIERCARSLFEQTYANLEYVFVNDCTSDSSIEILNQVMGEYPHRAGKVKIINHERNRGIAAARNTALDNATGEFVFHVDSDDWIEPNAVDLLVKKQQETGADIVSSSFYEHRTNEVREGYLNWRIPWQERNREETLKFMLNVGSVVAVWNRLIRRSLFYEHNVRWIEGIDAGEDLIITPRLVYFSKKVAFCNAITYHYDRSNVNAYTSLVERNWNVKLQFINAYLLNVDFFRDKGELLSELMDKQLVRRLERELNLAFKNHNRPGYNTMLFYLDDTNRKCWPLIKWDRPRRRWLDHHYYMKRIWISLSPILSLRCKQNKVDK